MSNYREYYKSIFGFETFSNEITFDSIYWGWRMIPIEVSVFKSLKDLYHQMVSVFGYQALEMIKTNGWFGRAYFNACMWASNGCKDEICLPTAKRVGIELNKLLKRAEYHGFVIDDIQW